MTHDDKNNTGQHARAFDDAFPSQPPAQVPADSAWQPDERVDLTARDDDIVVTAETLEPPTPQPPCHVMWDIETWGTGNDALPVSIGACKFTEDAIVDKFHVAIDPVSAQAFGLKIEADTVLWWMAPERHDALVEWLKMERVDLPSALIGLDMWVKSGAGVLSAWGNGSTFDNVILRSAFKAVGQEYPVRFWQDACYRTVKNRSAVAIERVGTHHNALDDAISQAKHLQRIWREQDQSDLRAMLERCAKQFEMYAESHTIKAEKLAAGDPLPTPELSSVQGKAAVNENLAFSIRQLLDGGPHQA